MLHHLRQDLRYGLRSLRRRPGFAVVAVLTIALGIGATTSIFSVVNGVLLEPLPLRDPGRLVVPEVIAPTGFEISLSIPNFRDWQERNRTLTSFGANAARGRTLTGGDVPEVVQVRLVLGEYFETLGVPAALGRWIPGEETWEGAEPVAVVTHGFWQRHFGGDPEALGRTLVLDGEVFTVVGVMPPGFAFPTANDEIYLPMGFFRERLCWDQRGCSQGTWAIGRLAAGVTLEAAQADLDRVAAGIREEEGQEVAVPRLQSLEDAYVGDIRDNLWILLAAVGFVLLIACANVAGLLLARGEGRRREIALRAALGAGRGRVLAQLLTESVLLGVAGGVVGGALAWAGTRVLLPLIADDLPSVMLPRVRLDGSVLLFTFGVAALAGMLFGLLPALRSVRSDLAADLREGSRGTVGRARQRLRAGFVVGQVALSLVLLIGAGLMLRSLARLQSVDKGFVAEGVLTAEIPLPRVEYDGKEAAWAFFRELHERVEALPDIRRASLSNLVPLAGNSWERAIWPEGVEPVQETANSVLFQMVTPGHFETLGIPLLRGRDFSDADRDGAPPVAIIDETMAEKFWPGRNPIGKRVTFEVEPGTDPHADNPPRVWRTVVGVARNVRHYELENPSRIQVYVPMWQSGQAWSTSMMVVAATAGDPAALAEPIRRQVAALDPDVPLDEVETLESYVDDALSGSRAMGTLLGVFAAVALVLSAIGLFGVMSYSVVQRLREIGIRMALGARRSDVLSMISRQGLALASIGVGIGLVAALGLTRLLSGALFEVDPVDPAVYAGLSGFLMAIALVAAWLPARRATRVDPAIVLREE